MEERVIWLRASTSYT